MRAAMAFIESEIETARRAAYEIAWHAYRKFPRLTPDELENAPAKISGCIQSLLDSGERVPDKIAASALGLIRQNEQIGQSKARISGC
jgi:hypothetical protein